ncbi:hypothetical protein BW14_05615 [Bifidobacterium sp. UTBIF-68]|uniref:ABC transporter permease subunit n=1 Tax=Bifidobacterium sp. UTBIF-68 TaxID=1465262 RepID=UPI00112A188A|nr:ABC transporter permease subunit [Bifidobacterium sp. UTBIF-68]TPF93290.1 hypothetical protein BW14_05615 [Bifidobacterium sp. UTBIF-68]
MNILIRELRSNAKPLVIWSLVVILFNVAGVMKFEGIAGGDPQSVRQLTEAFPKVALAVMGISDLDMTTFAGYYAVLMFYVGIMAAVYAVALAAHAVSREMMDGTYEFLFVRPVSRTAILTWKLVAALIDAVIFTVVDLVSALLCLPMLDGLSDASGSAMVVIRFAIWMLAMMLVFGALAACACAACLGSEHGLERGSLIGNSAVVVAYCAGVAYDMFSDHDASVVVRVLSPFRYAIPQDVIDGQVPMPFAILGVVIVVVCFAASYIAFLRRDLTSR